MNSEPEPAPQTRPWVVVVGGLIALAGLAWCVKFIIAHPQSLPNKDFVQYWSAAHVHLRQGNPYDAEQLRPLQAEALGEPNLARVTMMWNPPWVLTLVTPLGWMPSGLAHMAFLLVQLAALILSTTWLWNQFKGPPEKLWVAWFLALGFGPSVFIFWWGQIGGLLLLGLAGYLRYRDSRPFVAGLFAALLAIKPHLLFAVGLVLVLDALRSRSARKVIAGGALAFALAAAVAGLINPEVYTHYRLAGWESSTSINTSPKDWKQPLIAYWLRMAIDPSRFALQFIPLIITSLCVTGYWFVKRNRWDWNREISTLVFVSVLFTAYGAWMFDLVVLLVPVCAVSIAVLNNQKRRLLWFGGLTAMTVLATVSPWLNRLLTGALETPMQQFIWVSPAVLLLTVLCHPRRENRKLTSSHSLTEGEECPTKSSDIALSSSEADSADSTAPWDCASRPSISH